MVDDGATFAEVNQVQAPVLFSTLLRRLLVPEGGLYSNT